MSYSDRTLNVYWDSERGIHYRNGGEIIEREEAESRLKEGMYRKFNISWDKNSPLPVSIFKKMQKEKLNLEEKIK